MSSYIWIALSWLGKSVENGKELLVLSGISCFSKVSLLIDLISLFPSVAWSVPVSAFRLPREIFEKYSLLQMTFTKKNPPNPNKIPQPNPKPTEWKWHSVWKERDELDIGNVVNHEKASTLILLIWEVSDCALQRSLKLMGIFTPQ